MGESCLSSKRKNWSRRNHTGVCILTKQFKEPRDWTGPGQPVPTVVLPVERHFLTGSTFSDLSGAEKPRQRATDDRPIGTTLGVSPSCRETVLEHHSIQLQPQTLDAASQKFYQERYHFSKSTCLSTGPGRQAYLGPDHPSGGRLKMGKVYELPKERVCCCCPSEFISAPTDDSH